MELKKTDKLIIQLRKATSEDVDLYYNWANDELVRQNSFNSSSIDYNSHVQWFNKQLQSLSAFLYVFVEAKEQGPVGQVRINKGQEVIIGISIDQHFRGKSLGSKMLMMACEAYFKIHPEDKIYAYIKETNIASYKAFIQAGFVDAEKVNVNGSTSFRLYKAK